MMLIKSNTTSNTETTATTETGEQPRPKLRLIESRDDETLDFTRAVIVNRMQLAAAFVEARRVSSTLHGVENLDDLTWQEMCDLCRAAQDVVSILTAMLNGKQEEVTR